jgi:hypothetical protein
MDGWMEEHNTQMFHDTIALDAVDSGDGCDA